MEHRQRLKPLHARPEFSIALKLIGHLQARGFQAVLAGGSVRDSLLGRTPKDLDIATSASPADIEAAFPRTLAVGKAFGTIVVIEDGANFEVTTFRREGPYLDGRHPEYVELADMAEDARRRDFTANALFYDPVGEVVHDFADGIADIHNRCLRTVGAAGARFGEDHLRMLRAVRFVSQLGFTLDAEAAAAIEDLAPRLASVSAERVRAEVERLCLGEHLERALARLRTSRLTDVFWPELKRLEDFKPLAFTRWENAYAALMWWSGRADPEPRLRAWKASRESIRVVLEQTRAVSRWVGGELTPAQRLRLLGSDVFADVLVILSRLESAEVLARWTTAYLAVADARGRLPKPLVTGGVLLARGHRPGAEFGALLERAYDAQLEEGWRTLGDGERWLDGLTSS